MSKNEGQVLHTCEVCGRNFYGNPYGVKGYKNQMRCVNCANARIEYLEEKLIEAMDDLSYFRKKLEEIFQKEE